MSLLTADSLQGIWAGITMSWDDRDRFDETSYRANIEGMCKARVHGVYTTGSTGEFYALDIDEFKRMVDIQAEICGRFNMPLQIGCNADCTRKVIRLLEYAAGKPQVGAGQVVVPYWMELSDREVRQFFKDLYAACPDLPLVHYNIPRAKRYLLGPDYQRLLEVAPNLIGVKFSYAGSNFANLQDALRVVPQLSFFVGENLLVSAMMLGARGSYSSLICTNPPFTLAMYEHAVQGRWQEAMAMQKVAARFFSEAIAFIESRGEGVMDPIFDKGLAVASGCANGSQRTRAPYIAWSDETVQAMRQWLKKNYPQLLYGA